ncbi:MAG: TatD family hydrolase [Candidatus Thermoplasmatota archaeon]|nr:TatD family hydrolase [Candidatus Thermoplasmatota archaeon]
MIILDNHMHLRRDGRYIQAVKEFKRAGGTHLILCQMPMVEKVIGEKSYMPAYKETVKMAEGAGIATGIKIFVTVGPYPADYLALRKKFGRDEAKKIMFRGMEEAQQFCIERNAIAIGEIGRPHFEVDEQAWEDSNKIMAYGMKMAEEANVPVVLHTESIGPDGFKELAEMADRVGMEKARVVKHFSPPLVKEEENHGIFPSILSTEKAIKEALAKGTRFFMETDYIDDPLRPGAVLGLKTVPRRVKKFLEEGITSEEDVYKIHKDNPEKVYGISMD